MVGGVGRRVLSARGEWCELLERGLERLSPRPGAGRCSLPRRPENESWAATCQQPVARPCRFALGESAVQYEWLGPDDQVVRGMPKSIVVQPTTPKVAVER